MKASTRLKGFLVGFTMGLMVSFLCYRAAALARRAKEAKDPLAAAERIMHVDGTPRARTAMAFYQEALAQGDTRALLPTARIMDHGVPQGPEPVAANPYLAIDFYRKVAVLGTVREQAMARDRLVELGDRAMELPPPRQQRPRAVQAPATDDGGPRSDSQNVHDSTVVRSVKASLEKLPPSPLSMEETLKQVRTALDGDEDALKGLDLMERNTQPLSSLKQKETDVLRKVWGFIQGEQDGTKRADMVTMLTLRLRETGQEASCASGRVSRVVDALSTFHESVNLRPTWALRQEMLAKAARLRGERPEDGSTRPFKDVLRDAFVKDYVETGLASATVVDAELAAWGDDL
jgi:hypothetical protein